MLYRNLVSLQGARTLALSADYDSLLTINGPMGRGWSHNFETRLVKRDDGKIRIEWNAKRANLFTPDPAQPGRFTGADDRTRFDVLALGTLAPIVTLTGLSTPALDRSTGLFTQFATVTTSGATEFTLQLGDLPTGITLYNQTGTDASGRPLLKVQNPSGTAEVQVRLQYYSRTRVFTGLVPAVTLVDASGGLPPADFTYRAPDQSVLQFDVDGRLTRTLNRIGQRLELAYENTTFPKLVTRVTEPISGRALVFSYNALGKLTTVTDPLGRTVTLAQDLDDRLLSIKLQEGTTTSTETFSYNSIAQIVSARTNEGVTLFTNTYDSQGRVSEQRDTLNNRTTFAYDETTTPGQLITTVTDRTGQTLVFTHDNQYRLLSRLDANGQLTRFEYDSFGQRVAMHEPLGRTTTLSYDASGNLTSLTDPAGQKTLIAYDARRNPVAITDPAGKTTALTYNTANNLITLTDPLAQKTTFSYGPESLPTQVVNPRGGTVLTTYAAGLPTRIEQVDGTAITTTYDANGRLLTLSNPAGTYTFTYDLHGYLATVTDPLGRKTTYTHDSQGRTTAMTDALGQTTRYQYDGNGNPTRLTDALGQITAYAYDAEDRLRTVTDALGRTTTLAYDAAGRLLTVTDALGQAVSYTRDAAGDIASITDALGVRIASYTYDARRLPTRITDALNRVQEFAYDARGQVSRSLDPLSRATGYEYDALQRITQLTDALGQTTALGYDANGNASSLRNPRGQTSTSQFDAIDRLLSTSTPTGRKTTFTYDNRNLLATATEPSGQSTSLTRDAAGQVTRVQDLVGTIDFTRDALGRVTTVTEGGKSITRGYDALGRIVRFVNSEGEELRYGYDAVNNLTSLTYPDGKVVTYTYDAVHRMTQVTDWAGRVTRYTYDANGRPTVLDHANGTRRALTYDAMGQTLAITESAPGGGSIASFAHSYDAAGQLTQRDVLPAPTTYAPAAATLAYDADDRLTTFNSQPVVFDVDGNMTSGPLAGGFGAFTYDARNRLTSAGGVSYTYDAENRRLSMTTSQGVTRYTINPVAALSQILIKRDPSGTTTYYVYGLGLLYEETGGATRTYHYDHLGSTVALTDASGSVTGRAEYGPYGELYRTTGDTATPLLFNARFGVLTDPNGLYNMRARYYSPDVRRFLNSDPIGFTGGLNQYAYANGNPAMFIDPLGLFGWRDGVSIGVGFIPLVGTGQSFVELASGRDYITGEPANRWLAGAGLIAGLLPGGKGALKGGAKMFGAGAEHADEAVDLAKVLVREGEGVIYKRIDPRSGAEYVGQAINDTRYAARQGEHSRKAGGVPYVFDQLGSARPGIDLDILEEAFIRSEGGLLSKGGRLENLRHQLNPGRFVDGTNSLLRRYQGKMLIGNGLLNGILGFIENLSRENNETKLETK